MQNWKKGCVFGYIDKFWKGHDKQIKKNACKKMPIYGLFSYLKNTCFCESTDEPSCHSSGPPGKMRMFFHIINYFPKGKRASSEPIPNPSLVLL